MDNIVKTLALVCVFFVLTPGVLIQLPIKGGIYKIAAVHALLFGAIYFIVTNVFGVLREGAGKFTCPTSTSCNSRSDVNKYTDSGCTTICVQNPQTWTLKDRRTNDRSCSTNASLVANQPSACYRTDMCNTEKKKICKADPLTYTWSQLAR